MAAILELNPFLQPTSGRRTLFRAAFLFFMDDDSRILLELTRSPALLEEIAQAENQNELQLQKQLRDHYPADLVRAAFALQECRKRGRGKFTRAAEMWLTRVGLEQATAEEVARHKAARFPAGEHVFDLCCGIGSDTIGLARASHAVTAVDVSAAACLRTELNAGIYGVADRVSTITGNVTHLDLSETLVHIDPDRRAGRQRALRLEDYSPSLEFLSELQNRASGGGIKLSPASNFGGKFPGAEIELVSLHGECKEATVWFGSLSGDAPMRATVLPQGWTLAGNPALARPRLGPLKRYLFDPDPSVVRSGLLDLLTETLDVHRLDDAEEYLSADDRVDLPALTAFEVVEELPYNDKEVRRYYRSADVRELEILCRRVPVKIEALRRKLTLSGTQKQALIVARIAGRTRAIVARRCT